MCFDWGLNRVKVLPGLNLVSFWISIEPGMLWIGIELTWLVIFMDVSSVAFREMVHP